MLKGKDIRDYEFVIFVGNGKPHSDYMNHIEDFLFVSAEDFMELKDDDSVWKENPVTEDAYMFLSLNPFRAVK